MITNGTSKSFLPSTFSFCPEDARDASVVRDREEYGALKYHKIES